MRIFLFVCVFSMARFSFAEPLEGASLKAVALVVHGLNTKPEKMSALHSFLFSQNILPLNLSLTGHKNDLPEFKSVNANIWKRDFLEGYAQARTLADQHQVPLIFVGYSLGGALGVSQLAQENGSVRFEAMVLLAPALSIRSRSYFVRFFQIFGDDFMVPSMNHPDYKANEATSVAAYKGLFNLVAEIESLSSWGQVNIPTLVILDPQDELVDAAGLQKLIQEKQLTNWQMKETSNAESTLSPKFHHLILDELSLGARAWQELQDNIVDFLGSSVSR